MILSRRNCPDCGGAGRVLVPALPAAAQFPTLVEGGPHTVRCRLCHASGSFPPIHRRILVNGGWQPNEREAMRAAARGSP